MKEAKIVHWLPALAYMALIFVMSSFPAPQAIQKVPVFFEIKPVHIVEYGILSALVLHALLKTSPLRGIRLYLNVALIVLLYGASDEWHQHFVPGRSGLLMDLAANSLGTALICGLHAFSLNRRSR